MPERSEGGTGAAAVAAPDAAPPPPPLAIEARPPIEARLPMDLRDAPRDLRRDGVVPIAAIERRRPPIDFRDGRFAAADFAGVWFVDSAASVWRRRRRVVMITHNLYLSIVKGGEKRTKSGV